jgi:hypothetical protein
MSKGNSPAFPCQDNNKQIYTGMNLRDYFALEALNSLLRVKSYADIKKFAEEAYRISDAMLDERINYK